MTILIALFVIILVSYGMYLICTRRIPSFAAVSAVTHMGGNSSTIKDQLIYPLAGKIEKFSKLNPYKKRQYEKQLVSIGLSITPEFYIASAIAAAIYPLIGALVSFPLSPVLSIVFVIAAVIIFFREKNMSESIRRKKDNIEAEIPRLTSTIA